MIKIISGISFPGGSTVANINLCNLFNAAGYRCVFYGPHKWHLDKCPSGMMSEAVLQKEDIVLVHNVRLGARPNVSKYLLTCHEESGYPLRTMDLSSLDLIHFVSNSQRDWQNVNHPNVVIPNVINHLKPAGRQNTGLCVAGVIGNIDPHKQTHLSIIRAAEAGCDKILLFGNIMDQIYFNQMILPLRDRFPGRVVLIGYVDYPQTIYDSVDVVYHSSKRETFNYIKAECQLTGTRYEGLDSAETDAELLSASEILERWKSCLEL